MCIIYTGICLVGCARMPKGYCQEEAIYAGAIYSRAGYPVRIQAGCYAEKNCHVQAQAYKLYKDNPEPQWVYLYPISLSVIIESLEGDDVPQPLFHLSFIDYLRIIPKLQKWN